MKLKGEIAINASPRAIWDVMVAPLRLAGCVPGVVAVNQVDQRTFEGLVRAAVGPMSGEFQFTSEIVENRFPDELIVQVNGVDSISKSQVEMTVNASVSPLDERVTNLTYAAVVSVKGRLAILGEMMLHATANGMVIEVAKCLRAQLEKESLPGASGFAE
jgi:carbon monoxide dehydrogenase subunit G